MTAPHNDPTPWNNPNAWPGTSTAVLDPQQVTGPQPYQAGAQSQWAGAPAYGAPGTVPPQGPGYGWAAPAPAQPPSRTTLIVSLVVAAVLLIGGGIGAFLLLDRSGPAAPPAPAAPVTTQTSSTGLGTPTNTTTTSRPTTPPATTTSSTTASPATTSSTSPTTSTSTAPSEDVPAPAPAPAPGDGVEFAYTLSWAFVELINVGDYESAAKLICTPEQEGFVTEMGTGTPGQSLEVLDVQPSGDTMLLTIGAVGGGDTLELTMWPTDSGLYLICSNPLTPADQAL